MESCRQRSLRINRPSCLELRYPVIASQLIAQRILSESEHGNIKKLSPENVDRMDELISFLHKCDTEVAFDAFLTGVRGCKNDILADKLLRDSEESSSEDNQNGTSPGVTVSASIFEMTPSSPDLYSTPENLSQSQPCDMSSASISSSTSTSTSAATTPNGSRNDGRNSQSQSQSYSQTPPGFQFQVSPSQYFRRSTEASSRTAMTFGQALTRQRYGTVDFFFRNSKVRVETIHLNPAKSSITYPGCLIEIGNDNRRPCCSQVTQIHEGGNSVFVCKYGHHGLDYLLVPRLKVTFADDTGVFPLTLFRENVEKFLDMNTVDMSLLNPQEFEGVFEKVKTKEWDLEEVLCEKRKNPRFPWNNCVQMISPHLNQPSSSSSGKCNDDIICGSNLPKRRRI